MVSQLSSPSGMAFNLVALCRIAPIRYPTLPPFDPSESYPELEGNQSYSSEGNGVFRAVRDILSILRLDEMNQGTSRWNPLRDLVNEGGSVVIKPNLVSEPRGAESDSRAIVTHGSVIRPIIDYAIKAVGDGGEITVADAPQFDSDFGQIIKLNGLKETVDILSERTGMNIGLLDLRLERVDVKDGVIKNRHELSGDPKGYTIVNLGSNSRLAEIESVCHRLRGSDYDRSVTTFHHSQSRHEYFISNTALEADCVISVPKLKTHKKAGVTLNLKNFVGVNGSKNFIPHYRIGTIRKGGDEFNESGLRARSMAIAYEVAQRTLPRAGAVGSSAMSLLKQMDDFIVTGDQEFHRSGDWYGNDTVWRSILDLYSIVLNRKAKDGEDGQSSGNLLSIVDGVIGGEGEGPLSPDPITAGILLGGRSLVAVDIAAIACMGFDITMFPTYSQMQSPSCDMDIEEFADWIEVRSVGDDNEINMNDLRRTCKRAFKLPSGWTDRHFIREHRPTQMSEF